MLIKIMLSLALLFAGLATVPAVSGSRASGQAALSYHDGPVSIGSSAGGNLVPLW
jgi:hypothetical protein